MTFAFAILFLWGPFARAESAFYAEWRAETNARLAKLLPTRSTATLASETGVSITDLAAVLGGSVPAASMLLTGRDRHLGLKHADKIAQAFNVDANDVLAVDLLDRFGSVAEVEAALAGEARPLVNFFIRLYARRSVTGASIATDDEWPNVTDFITRWHAEVLRRLAQLMPDSVVRALYPKVSLFKLAEVLGQTKSVAFNVVYAGQHLTFDQAAKVAAKYGVRPEWVLASEMLGEFNDLAHVERAFAKHPMALRPLMLRLYADHLAGCRGELRVIKAAGSSSR